MNLYTIYTQLISLLSIHAAKTMANRVEKPLYKRDMQSSTDSLRLSNQHPTSSNSKTIENHSAASYNAEQAIHTQASSGEHSYL